MYNLDILVHHQLFDPYNEFRSEHHYCALYKLGKNFDYAKVIYATNGDKSVSFKNRVYVPKEMITAKLTILYNKIPEHEKGQMFYTSKGISIIQGEEDRLFNRVLEFVETTPSFVYSLTR